MCDQKRTLCAYLLEGLIDRDGTVPDTVTIHARLVSPNEKQPVVIDVSGPRRDLPTVVGSEKSVADQRG